jgi:molybdopterin molybdotransferase
MHFRRPGRGGMTVNAPLIFGLLLSGALARTSTGGDPDAAMETHPLPFDVARRIVQDQIKRLVPTPASETVELEQADGRVLAAPVRADRDYPPFHRSARDGFAVIASDVAKTPARLRVIGQTRAGEPSQFRLQHGETVEIMTGAPGPAGSDAVVMVEYSSREGDSITLAQGVASGANLVFQGSEARAGSTVLEPGTVLDYRRIALLASVGRSRVTVYRKPRVAILSTGDEVVPVDTIPEPFQIRNSNAWSLAAQVRRRGGEPAVLPIAPDQISRTRELIEQGLRSDLLLLSGGVSMGKYDLVEQVLKELGAEFFFTQVAIQPGKPLVFGRGGSTPVFGLPGNPISTMVTFEVFARIAVDLLAGRSESPLPFVQARLKSNFQHKPVLTRFLPAVLEGDYGEATVNPLKWQGSGDLVAAARANCYLVAAAGQASWKAGEWISILP